MTWEHIYNYVASPTVAEEMMSYRTERRRAGYKEYTLGEDEQKYIQSASDKEWRKLSRIMDEVEGAHRALEGELARERRQWKVGKGGREYRYTPEGGREVREE